MQIDNTALSNSRVGEVLARVVCDGDLSKLSPHERVVYYNAVCQSLGLNPLTKPFDLLKLNGKLMLYARKDCTDQLRRLHNISLKPPQTSLCDGIFAVTISASTPDGRTDTDLGAVSVKGLSGDQLCNAMMRAVTKSKRRVTLAICGLGMLDESEVEHFRTSTNIDKPRQETGEVWRGWRTPGDAIKWAATVLPGMPRARIEELYHELPARNGKKAQVWAEFVIELASRD